MHVYENYFRIFFLVIACFTSSGQLTFGREYINKDASLAGTVSPYQRESLIAETQDWRRTLLTNPPCAQPMEVGPCKKSLERWFYNVTSQQCQKFTYGGCGGGRNNFRSFEECQSFCMSIQVTSGLMTSSNSSNNRPPISDPIYSYNNLGVNADPGSNPSAVTRQDPYVNIKLDMNALNSRVTENQQSQPGVGYTGAEQILNGNNSLDTIPDQDALTKNMSFKHNPLHAVVNINIICKVQPCPQPTTSNATVTPLPSVTQSSINYTVQSSTGNENATSTLASTPAITAPAITAPVVSPPFTVTVTSTILATLPLSVVPQGISPNTTEVVQIPPLASSTIVATPSVVPASTFSVMPSASQASQSSNTSVTPYVTAVLPTPAPVPNTACRRANDVGIVLDSSQSTKPDDFYKVKQFLVNFTDKFEVSANATHFSLIAYSQESGFYFNFSNNDFWDHKTLGDNIRSLPWVALQTRTDKALELADSAMFTATNGDRADTPDTLVVVAFGKTEPKESKPYEIVLAALKKKSIKIIAIGVGPDIDRDELLLIANGDSSHVVKIDSTRDLSSFIDALVLLACR